ncbi:uncharacterized protein LOC103955387 isoform X2 [Pyrus x bretschneideri]|uniref:uncharacterized protein LOC103955387 isoform X2 n=1 Tax=Pyrus x bretschneideri TaxID=225117 RepID=UPI0005118087|nr:uncharacterized protein LOC103955387 isoform X2 [Pyrus x bretschneideri]
MGSLVPGWDSPVLRSKPGAQRNKSLTKEEIEAYWKAHKKSNSISREISTADEPGRRFQKSSSFPVTTTKISSTDTETSPRTQKILNNNGWWTASNWAFLNEPPILEEGDTKTTYAAQFHVANSWAPKSNGRDQIST